jgi:phage gp29-like protein
MRSENAPGHSDTSAVHGGRGQTASAADPQSQLDALPLDQLHDQAQALIQPLLGSLKQGLSPEQALDALAEAYPQMDADLLTEALARAMFALELAGRLEAQDDD